MPPCTCGLGLSYTNMQHHIPYPPVCTWQLLRGYSYRIHPCGHKHCCKQPFYTTLYTVDSYYTNGSNGSNGINGCNGCFILHKNTPRRVSVTLRSVSNYAILITPPSAARRCTTTAGGWPHFPRGGETMRITMHIGSFTVTIIIKKRKNRHSAK